MKTRLKWMVIPAFALGLGACKKEEPSSKGSEAESPGIVEKTVEKVKDAVAEIAKPSATAEERAAKLGFAKHLPADVESVISVHQSKKTIERTKALDFWKLVEDEMGVAAPDEALIEPPAEGAEVPAAEAPPLAPEVPVEEDPAVAGAFHHSDLWGNEITVALGETGGEQLGNLLHLSTRFSYFQMRQMTRGLVSQLKTGNDDAPLPFDEQMMTDLVNDPEGGVTTFEKMGLPPIYIAAKVDPAKLEEAGQQISSSLGIIGSLGDVELVEVEKAGAKFTGYKLAGTKLAERMAGERAQMEERLDPETVERLFASIAKKDLVLLSGTVGEYVVLFLGGSADQFELAADVKDSLAGNKDALGFADEFLSKDLMAWSYGDKAALQHIMDNAGRLSDTAMGIRDGLAGEDGLGETREIESLLQVVIEREEALRKFTSIEDSGTVAYFENGLKIESFGGIDQGVIGWETPATLGNLGDSSEVVFFAHMTADPAYSQASGDFLEALAETAYAISRKVSALPDDNPDLTQFKQMSNLFDENFRNDAIGLWQALSDDLADGLGHESAIVVDVKGTVPTIPGLPQAVIDQGNFPRISLISPVTDRAKLASSWEKMNQSTTGILAKVSELTGQEIPMQKPISSEKDDLTTWFFPMPFFNDDFLPSVTVGDKWFVASTSKLHAVDLVAAADEAKKGEPGLSAKLNFVMLQAYAKDMLKVVDENSQAIFGEDHQSYVQEKDKIVKIIDAFDDLDSLIVSGRRDGDVVRTSIHFKTR